MGKGGGLEGNTVRRDREVGGNEGVCNGGKGMGGGLIGGGGKGGKENNKQGRISHLKIQSWGLRGSRLLRLPERRLWLRCWKRSSWGVRSGNGMGCWVGW